MDLVDLETDLENLLSGVDNMVELSEGEIYQIKVPLSKLIHVVSLIRKRKRAFNQGFRVLEVVE